MVMWVAATVAPLPEPPTSSSHAFKHHVPILVASVSPSAPRETRVRTIMDDGRRPGRIGGNFGCVTIVQSGRGLLAFPLSPRGTGIIGMTASPPLCSQPPTLHTAGHVFSKHQHTKSVPANAHQCFRWFVVIFWPLRKLRMEWMGIFS